MSMRVVDSSRPLGITVSVFRPRKDALPRVEVGDCVLLRNFKVRIEISYSHSSPH